MHESLKSVRKSVEKYTPWAIQRRFNEMVREAVLREAKLKRYKSESEFHQYAKSLFLETYNSVHQLIDKEKPVQNYDMGYRDAILKGDTVLYHITDLESPPDYSWSSVVRVATSKTNQAEIEYVLISQAKDHVKYIITGTTNDIGKFKTPFTSESDTFNLSFTLNEGSQIVNVPDKTAILLKMDKELRLMHFRNVLGENNLELPAPAQTFTRTHKIFRALDTIIRNPKSKRA